MTENEVLIMGTPPNNLDIFGEATAILRSLYGATASFRDGQYEAIEATMTQNRTLVVQRTGWGKSLVYFICTKLMRERCRGVTVVVSPLLVLMENQIEAAERLGLRCDVLNSTTKDRREEILHSLEKNELDLVLVTPRRCFAKMCRVGSRTFGSVYLSLTRRTAFPTGVMIFAWSMDA